MFKWLLWAKDWIFLAVFEKEVVASIGAICWSKSWKNCFFDTLYLGFLDLERCLWIKIQPLLCCRIGEDGGFQLRKRNWGLWSLHQGCCSGSERDSEMDSGRELWGWVLAKLGSCREDWSWEFQGLCSIGNSQGFGALCSEDCWWRFLSCSHWESNHFIVSEVCSDFLPLCCLLKWSWVEITEFSVCFSVCVCVLQLWYYTRETQTCAFQWRIGEVHYADI